MQNAILFKQMTLVFWAILPLSNSQGNSHSGDVKHTGWEKFAIFPSVCHRQRGSAALYILTATPQVSGKGRILTPYRIEALEAIAKKLAQLIRVDPTCQIWWQSNQGIFWQMGEIIYRLWLFIFYLFDIGEVLLK